MIKQDAGGNSRVLCWKVDDSAEKEDKDSREEGVSSVSVMKLWGLTSCDALCRVI